MHFDTDINGADGLRCLAQIAQVPTNKDRVIFSEYHAAGAVSGAFMLRKGCWKYNYYIGFDPELFDLEDDPEELKDLAPDPAFAEILTELEVRLRNICDPEVTDAQAFADQRALVDRLGGRDAALALGAPGATPPPVPDG